MSLPDGLPFEKKGDYKMELTSSAFSAGEMIPKKYTCDDVDISPPLKWQKAPAGTVSFALIADDPDAPMGTWVHWVLFNIPAGTTELPEAFPAKEKFADGAIHGKNDFGKFGYGGPCPPGGTHRYFFKLYALKIKLDLKPGAAEKNVMSAMQNNILSECRLMGKYKRQR